jgi:hypothetical protein
VSKSEKPTENEQLRQSRSAALELLARDAEVSELKDAAFGLGSALRDAANDKNLWNRVREAKGKAYGLNEQQRVQLTAALSISWPELLLEVGYQSPPPPNVYGAELTEAIRAALASGESASVDAVQEKLRVLGEKLVELSGQQQVAPSRLRRWLRKGARVAGKVIVVVGLAGAGVALAHALPGLMALPVFLGEIGIEAAKDGASEILNDVLDRVLGEEGEQGRGDAADREAVDSIRGVNRDDLGNLIAYWEFEKGSDLEATRRFVERTLLALFLSWDAAVGAPWYGTDLEGHFTALASDLGELRDALKERGHGARETAEALRGIAGGLDTLPDLLERLVEEYS